MIRFILQLEAGAISPHMHRCPLCMRLFDCGQLECALPVTATVVYRKVCPTCKVAKPSLHKLCPLSPHRYRHEVYELSDGQKQCVHCRATTFFNVPRTTCITAAPTKCPSCGAKRAPSTSMTCGACA